MADRDKMVWYIHGANSTAVSFAYLKLALPSHQIHDISYSNDVPLRETIDKLVDGAAKARPFSIVAHSLGGIVAVALAQATNNVERIVTMSTPFGGSRTADLMRWVFPCQLFEDIKTSSPVLAEIRRRPLRTPTLSLVTNSGGLALIGAENDGVVTVESQLALPGPRYISLPLNHHEILLADEPISYIKDFIFDGREATASPRYDRPAGQRQVHVDSQLHA